MLVWLTETELCRRALGSELITRDSRGCATSATHLTMGVGSPAIEYGSVDRNIPEL